MHICRPIFKFAFFLNLCFFCIPFFFPLRICKLTILEYVAVYSWSLQSTLTGIPLLENSNRVAIQFGASTWVNSMKPTEAELYHSLGDGGNEWKLLYLYKNMDTWHRCSPIQANKGQSKEIKMRSLLAWRCNTGLASIYKPIYYRRKVGGRGPEYFIVSRGGISYSLFLGFRILRIHICQLSSRKVQRKRTKSIWALWSKAWSSLRKCRKQISLMH